MAFLAALCEVVSLAVVEAAFTAPRMLLCTVLGAVGALWLTGTSFGLVAGTGIGFLVGAGWEFLAAQDDP